MIRVLIDTNILLANLRGPRPNNTLKLVLADAGRDRFRLVVPELVVRELVNKKREGLVDADHRLRQSHALLAEVGYSAVLPRPDLPGLLSGFERHLRDMLRRANAHVPGLSAVAHEELVTRALERRKPFSSTGAGYRDALIWHTVLELLAHDDEALVLVTNNSKDFAEAKHPRRLSDDLRRDLADARVDHARVQLLPSLDDFAEEHIAPETIAEGELEAALNEDTDLRRNFQSGLQERLSGHVFDQDDVRRLDASWLDLGYDVDDAKVDSAEVVDAYRLHGVWVNAANLLDETRALVQLEAEIDAVLETTLQIRRRRTPFDDDLPERERLTRTFDTTLLIGAEATFRRDIREIEDLYVFHVSA